MTLVPQLGMVEFLVLCMIALIVVGPKDLPKLMHGAGKAMAKVRAMADEFRAGFQQMAREAEIDEMRKEIEALKSASIDDDVRSAMDDIGRSVRGAPSAPPSAPSSAPARPAEPPAAPAPAAAEETPAASKSGDGSP